MHTAHLTCLEAKYLRRAVAKDKVQLVSHSEEGAACGEGLRDHVRILGCDCVVKATDHIRQLAQCTAKLYTQQDM